MGFLAAFAPLERTNSSNQAASSSNSAKKGRLTPASTADLPTTYFNPADAGYFDTMGIPLLEDRDISDTDRRDSPPARRPGACGAMHSLRALGGDQQLRCPTCSRHALDASGEAAPVPGDQARSRTDPW